MSEAKPLWATTRLVRLSILAVLAAVWVWSVAICPFWVATCPCSVVTADAVVAAWVWRPEIALVLVVVRVSSAADLTTTFKLRKVDLQRQGYDPRAFDDPLYVRDEAAATYVPFSPAALERAGLPPFA